jgi:hypothetical protein
LEPKEKGSGSSLWGNVVSVGLLFGICNLKRGLKKKEEQVEGRTMAHQFPKKRLLLCVFSCPLTSVPFSE